MTIAIDASRAFVAERTGIEEYSYQVIRNLRETLADENVVLYVRPDRAWGSNARAYIEEHFFTLPAMWRVVPIHWRRGWTQLGLSLAMLRDRPDALLILAHTVPLIHPRNTIVVIHGLEYEVTPQAYSLPARVYMRLSIRFSACVSRSIIAVSQNTKHDLMRLYRVPERKIHVVYEGVNPAPADDFHDEDISPELRALAQHPYILFIGRLEERKNIVRAIQAFDLVASQRSCGDVRLVLAGKPGYGFTDITHAYGAAHHRDAIDLVGFVTEAEKWFLLRHARAFYFATLYEGFGLPLLEAQQCDVPVVTSQISSLPEVAGDSAVFVDPYNTQEIAHKLRDVLCNDALRRDIISRGCANITRFSWAQCAQEIAAVVRHNKK
jgi:glycosyltransferase involved in cell wall biosynthesis